MKLFVSLCVVLAAVDAFAPTPFGVRRSMEIAAVRPDTTEYVNAALAASKKFGPASKEARMAWEIVEELDSSDNSNAYTGGVTDAECLVAEEAESQACKDYNDKLVELAKLLEDNAPKLESIKTLAHEIQAIKIATPSVTAGADSPMLREALQEAKDATAQYGIDSKEARLAWEDVEELAAAGLTNSLGSLLEDECIVEKIEACEGLEELQRVLNLNTHDSRYGG